MFNTKYLLAPIVLPIGVLAGLKKADRQRDNSNSKICRKLIKLCMIQYFLKKTSGEAGKEH